MIELCIMLTLLQGLRNLRGLFKIVIDASHGNAMIEAHSECTCQTFLAADHGPWDSGPRGAED